MTKRQRRSAQERVREFLAGGDLGFEPEDRCEVLEDGPEGRTLATSPVVRELLQAQRAAFVAKFGREPADADPIFFDPNADEPVPFDAQAYELERIKAMLFTGIHPAMVYASAVTGHLPVLGINDHLMTDADESAWDAAIDAWRDRNPDGPGVRPAEGPAAVVYVLRAANDGLVKIGTTTDLPSRLKNIRAMSGVPLEVLCVLPGDATVERQLHARFREHRAHGEWFRPAPDLLAWVESARWGAA